MYIYSWIIGSFILSLSVYYERLFENKKSKSSPHRLTFVFEIDFYLTYFLPGEKKPATTSEFCTPLDKYLLLRDSVRPSFFSPSTLAHVKSRSIFIFSRFVRHRGAPFLEVLITNFTSPFPYFRLGIYIYIHNSYKRPLSAGRCVRHLRFRANLARTDAEIDLHSRENDHRWISITSGRWGAWQQFQ